MQGRFAEDKFIGATSVVFLHESNSWMVFRPRVKFVSQELCEISSSQYDLAEIQAFVHIIQSIATPKSCDYVRSILAHNSEVTKRHEADILRLLKC